MWGDASGWKKIWGETGEPGYEMIRDGIGTRRGDALNWDER